MNDVTLKPGLNALEHDAPPSTQRLEPNEIPSGEPLKFDIVNPLGIRLLKAGTVLPSPEARDFLLAHFKPSRLIPVPDKISSEDQPPGDAPVVPPSSPAPLVLDDMNIKTGALLRIRMAAQTGYGVLNSLVIGFAPNRSLFVTPPHATHQIDPVTLLFGERIDVLFMNRRTVYDFVCTVDAVCRQPFDFLVLSPPSNIRQLRARNDTRMRTVLPILFRNDANTGADSPFTGLGLLRDLSAGGLSMAASGPVAAEGEKIRVAFEIVAAGIDVKVDTVVVIRNIRHNVERSPWVMHGMEFQDLDTATQLALRYLAVE